MDLGLSTFSTRILFRTSFFSVFFSHPLPLADPDTTTDFMGRGILEGLDISSCVQWTPWRGFKKLISWFRGLVQGLVFRAHTHARNIFLYLYTIQFAFFLIYTKFSFIKQKKNKKIYIHNYILPFSCNDNINLLL